MTLIRNIQRRCVFATVILTLICYPLYAKGKLTLSGRVIDTNGKKVKKAMVTLLSNGEVVSE